jgi:hypothetical protein
MPDWPQLMPTTRHGRGLNIGDNINLQTLATYPGSANVKGAWSTVIASCPIDASGFWLVLSNSRGGAQHWYLDIGIGDAGSEVVIFPDLYVHPLANDLLNEQCYIPLRLPAGARVAMRGQAQAGAIDLYGTIVPHGGPFMGHQGYTKVVSAGLVAPTTYATTAQNDYPGPWTALADPTPEMHGILLSHWPAQVYTNPFTSVTDLALSASGAGSPTDALWGGCIANNYPANQGNQKGCLSGTWPCYVPPGMKLWVRSTGGGYAGNFLKAVVYGFQ